MVQRIPRTAQKIRASLPCICLDDSLAQLMGAFCGNKIFECGISATTLDRTYGITRRRKAAVATKIRKRK
jgi:hypothetical protein